jgi:hypothetical protein
MRVGKLYQEMTSGDSNTNDAAKAYTQAGKSVFCSTFSFYYFVDVNIHIFRKSYHSYAWTAFFFAHAFLACVYLKNTDTTLLIYTPHHSIQQDHVLRNAMPWMPYKPTKQPFHS